MLAATAIASGSASVEKGEDTVSVRVGSRPARRTLFRYGTALPASDEHLARRPLSQEGGRACRGAIGPRLEQGDQIADRGAGQRDLVAEAVERRAQAADDRQIGRASCRERVCQYV